MKKNKKLLVVSNMYPTKKYPFYGVFVDKFCKQLTELNIEYDKCVMHFTKNKGLKALLYIFFYIKSFLYALSGRYSAVYVHYVSHSSIGVLLAKHFKKFIFIANVHGSDVVCENKKQEKMQKYAKKSIVAADFIVAPSQYFKNLVEKKYNVSSEKICVYPSGGIEGNLFYPCNGSQNTEKIKKELNINNNLKTIAFVGRLSYGKGWKTYLQATKILIERGYELNILVVGSGNEQNEYNNFVKENQLFGRIKYFPLVPREKLAEIYRCVNYFIFPTEREGESLGLVALEAMASGCIVISSDFAAPKYYIDDGINGFKFEMGNADSLSRVIEKVIGMDENDQNAIINNGLLYSSKFSDENSKKILSDILADKLGL